MQQPGYQQPMQQPQQMINPNVDGPATSAYPTEAPAEIKQQ
jgi:hypothetical protein